MQNPSPDPPTKSEAPPAFEIESLTKALKRIQADAVAAIEWYESNKPEGLRHLTWVSSTLKEYDLVASADLGDRGFKIDDERSQVQFNGHILANIITGVENVFTATYQLSADAVSAAVDRAVGLYVFHETFHVTQRFSDHAIAAVIKEAFGPDELSKLDLCADIVAAHCQAIVTQSIESEFGWENYLQNYGSNITLSYHVLTSAFSKLGDHKKRRALGLLTSRLLVQMVASSEDNAGLTEFALQPTYTSIAPTLGYLAALTSGENAWEVLFSAEAADRALLHKLWDETGTGLPADLIGLMYPMCEARLPSRA